MAGNQEPMLRHIKRSTGGRSQSSVARILKRGGCTPTVSRGKLRARAALYICIVPCHILFPRRGSRNRGYALGLKIKFSDKKASTKKSVFFHTSAESSNL